MGIICRSYILLFQLKYPVGKDYDIVLVGAESTTDLKKAYPSYFLDTTEFLI